MTPSSMLFRNINEKDMTYSLLTEHINILNEGFFFFHMESLEQCFQFHMQFPGSKWTKQVSSLRIGWNIPE